MSELGTRLKSAREKAGLSMPKLAELVGITWQTIQQIEAGKSRGTKHIVAMAKALGVTPEWLAIGTATAAPTTEQAAGTDFPGNIVDLGGTEFARIPVYDVRFSAGFGAHNDSEQPLAYHEIGMAMLRRFTDAPVNRLAFLQVNGDSMEPLLFNKDWVLIDANRTSLVTPAIYAISFNGEGFLKHASQNLETGAITLVSHNPAYPPQTIAKPDGLRVVGRVVLSIRTH